MKVEDAVVILHGATGGGATFLRPEFDGGFFGEGPPIDATRLDPMLSDGIGHGGSNKPSDDLHAQYPATATAT